MEVEKKEKKRGVLNNTELKEKISKQFPEFNITAFVRFLPYLDYCLKNQGFFNMGKMSIEENDMLDILGEKGQIGRTDDRIEFVTKAFFEFMQDILFDCYVCII